MSCVPASAAHRTLFSVFNVPPLLTGRCVVCSRFCRVQDAVPCVSCSAAPHGTLCRVFQVLSSADIIAMQKKTDGKRKIFAIFGKKSKPVSRTFSPAQALHDLASLNDRMHKP